jgi:nitrogen-specific signal transduction histidine kinase
LGLPLAMKIIRMHEGGVQVQSEKIKEPSWLIVFKANIKILMLNLRKF